ncbi:hypothetical protein Tco_0830383 [Tanacetum coccineum]
MKSVSELLIPNQDTFSQLVTESMLDGTFTSFDEKWKRFSDQVNAQFNGNEGGRGLEGIDLNITFESHEIQSESHEIHSESHKIHSESHKIQSESHEIRKDLLRSERIS